MAFDRTHLQINRGVTTANAQGNGITIAVHTYKSATDAIATIEGANYFPPNFTPPVTPAANISVQPDNDEIFVGDLLFVDATDDTGLYRLATVNPVTLGDNLVGGATSNLTIGAPIAATDGNALKITAGVLQAQIADTTHAGIVTDGAQEFAGIKGFATGINADSIHQYTPASPVINIGDNTLTHIAFGGPTISFTGFSGNLTDVFFPGIPIIHVTGALRFASNDFLSNFYYLELPVDWTGPWGATTLPGTLVFTRFNDQVTISGTNVPATASTVATSIQLTAVFPANFRPALNKNQMPIRVTDNSLPDVGAISVSTGGNITIGAGASGGAFAAAGNAAFFDFSVSYGV